VGIFFESVIKIPQIFVCGFLILGIVSVCTSLFFKKINFIIGFCLLLLVLGILRVQISEFNIGNDKLSKLNGKGGIALTGIIYAEPDLRDASQIIKVKIDLPAQAGNSTILVTTKRYPEYNYLDKIKLTGKLETPSETDDFSYKNYLMKDGIYSVMGFPKIELLSKIHEHNVFSYLYEKILFCKQKIRESIQKNFLPPQSSIMEGTILGDNGAMTPDLKNKLNITGLRHIIAVSGTHVVILGAIIMSLLLAMGLWRGQAFYIAIISICMYVILTGLPPSGVRAGIMGGIFLIAQKIGRQGVASRLIVIACAGMLTINPLLLFYDIGFQLSFLAVLGLIYLEPIIKFLLKKLIRLKEKSQGEELLSMVSTTFAAQIFTLPIMIYNFGNISFVSPITNLLVGPIVYWLMVFGFLASIVGVFSSVLGFILSIPCWVLLTYFIKIIDFFSQPWMAETLNNVSWIWVFISYSLVSSITWLLRKKYLKKIV
jgi:competence protein ComEC